MSRYSNRIFLGAVAGALSMLVFHQTTLQIFFWTGLAPQAAFRVAQVPPFNAPMVVSLTFWGAVYGGIFGFVMPRIQANIWLKCLSAGLCGMLLAWFVFQPLMGHPAAFGWQPWPMLRSAIAWGMWGVGLRLFLPLLRPRRPGDLSRNWDTSNFSA